jgi:uncharacterized membrane protein
MPVVLALIGFFGGASLAEWHGAVFGAILGYVSGHLLALKSRVADLARELQELRDSRPSRSRDEFEPPVAAARAQSPPERPAEIRVAASPPTAPRPEPRFLTKSHAAPLQTQGVADETSDGTASESYEEFAPLKWLREFFTGGNTVVRVSIAILFVGVALLLQYASEHGYLPVETRLIGVAVGALVLLVLGWRLRHRRWGYAIALQGGGTGILYLTIFFALRTYSLVPASAAFFLLLAVVLLSSILAVLQDALWLALLGATGGFLAPILASTGEGNHVVLFTFYALLNVGIVAIAWFKAWRPLNVVGFAFTFVIGALWGVQRYTPALFASTEPFLILFFLMYVAVAILFAARREPHLKGYIDGTIVFGTPIAAFGLQSAMLHDRHDWLSFSAMAVSAMYLALAWMLWRRRPTWRLLAESFLALSVAFATLAIPLALNGRWSAATWALEGAALLWVGSRQSQLLPRLAGLALQFAAAAMFLRDQDHFFTGIPVLNSTCLGALLVAGAGVYSSHLLKAYADRVTPFERMCGSALFLWALLWWLIGGLGEIDRSVPTHIEPRAAVAFLALTSVLCSEAQRRLRIEIARVPALCLLPAMSIFVAIDWFDGVTPFARFGWLVWPLAWSAFYLTLRRHEAATASRATAFLHVWGGWLLVLLISREVASAIDGWVAGAGSWPAIAWAVVPALALLLSRRLERWLPWPVAAHVELYVGAACGGLALYLLLWSVFTSIARDGDPFPLPYIPFVNPLDLAQVCALLGGIAWLRHQRETIGFVSDGITAALIGIVVFIWLNAVLLRAIHYWVGVPYLPDALWGSTLVQTALSIFWTCLALTTMLVAARTARRWLWFIGAALMGVVVLKLFVVDLPKVGSIARIVSFLGVGIIMLVIGYLSPLPPQTRERQR